MKYNSKLCMCGPIVIEILQGGPRDAYTPFLHVSMRMQYVNTTIGMDVGAIRCAQTRNRRLVGGTMPARSTDFNTVLI